MYTGVKQHFDTVVVFVVVFTVQSLLLLLLLVLIHNSLATKERLIESQTGNCTASASNKSNSSGKIWRHGCGGHGAASWYSDQTVAHK